MTGAGTVDNPYIIWDVNDLQDMANGAPYAADAYYELGANIDATPTTGWNWDAGRGVFEGFLPRNFSGQLNGRFYIIQGLYIDRYIAGDCLVGLFAAMSFVIIQDLLIFGADITGYSIHASAACSAAGLASTMDNGIVRRVYAEGQVRGTTHDTSLPGVSAGQSGGLIGRLQRGTVEICATNVDVYHTGVDHGVGSAGGLIGRVNDNLGSPTIRNCYTRGPQGAIRSGFYSEGIGGLIGMCNNTVAGVNILNCYATGAILPGDGSLHLGGIVGRSNNNALILSVGCFWDRDTTGVTTNAGPASPQHTPAMKTASIFLAAGWDFNTIWAIDTTGVWNDGYPYHLWHSPAVIHVVVPNGGETWYVGSTYTILWNRTTSIYFGPNVRVELLKGGVLDEVLAASTPIGPPGGGTYSWTIDPGKTPGPDYRVQITDPTSLGTDTSDNDFAIVKYVPPPLAVATLPATGVG